MQYILVFRLCVIISKSEAPASTFQNNLEMWMNEQYHGIDGEFAGWKSGHSFKYVCDSPHNFVMTLHWNAVSFYSFCTASVCVALLGCCICCSWSPGKDSRFQREAEDSDSIRRTSCKVWHVKTVWNTGRKKVLWGKLCS